MINASDTTMLIILQDDDAGQLWVDAMYRPKPQLNNILAVK